MKLLKSFAAAAVISTFAMPALSSDLITIVGFDNLSDAECPIVRDPMVVGNTLDYALNMDFLLFPGNSYQTARCMFNTTVKVKSGYKMRVNTIGFGGNFDQEGDTRGRVTASWRMLGSASPVSSTGWMSSSQPFLQVSPDGTDSPWSSCGATVQLEARSDAALMSPSSTGFANMIIQNAAGGFMAVRYECVPC